MSGSARHTLLDVWRGRAEINLTDIQEIHQTGERILNAMYLSGYIDTDMTYGPAWVRNDHGVWTHHVTPEPAVIPEDYLNNRFDLAALLHRSLGLPGDSFEALEEGNFKLIRSELQTLREKYGTEIPEVLDFIESAILAKSGKEVRGVDLVESESKRTRYS